MGSFCETLESRALLSASAVGATYSVPADPRATLDLKSGWKFIRSDPAGAQATSFNDSTWSAVNLPHTWNALDGEDGGGDYYRGVGWYRRSVTVPSSMSGDSIHARFDGSSLGTTLYVDGTLVGSHLGAFGAFDFDLTTALASGGTHQFAVKVDNSLSLASAALPQSGDFTVFGGIYRGVSLIGANKQQVSLDDFASSGVFFTTPSVSATSASVQVKTDLANVATASKSLTIHTVLADATGKIVAETSTAKTLAAGERSTLTQTSTVTNPHLWNGRPDPYLHDLYVEVRDATSGTLLDLVHQRVGIRSYQITTSGFYLNGAKYDLHGASIHQDREDEGWAISDADIREDLAFFMEIGATALRTAHYEQSQLLYDLCDQDGIVVYTEVPNVGSNNGGVIPTTAAFAANAQQQLKELIRQRFNHPSIIIWGVFNEVANSTDNVSFVQTMNALAHAEDPSRLTGGASNRYNLTALERATDVAAFNRYYGWYYGVPADFAGQLDMLHGSTPLIPVGVTEYGAGASIDQHQENPPAPQQDGPFHPEEYQSIYHEQTYKVLKARPWVWASFIWNMFDFASDARDEGDTPGRNDKGLVTYDRKTKKDAFYFYKANWSADPVLYITSRRWTQRTAATTQIKIYSNVTAPTVKLNGIAVALTNNGNDVWTTANVTLVPGNNVVNVTGTRNGQTYSDAVTWTLPGGPVTPPDDGTIRVNFQPNDGGLTPAGYAVDSGQPFGTRANGAQYGWNGDNSPNTRRRNLLSDVRLDTYIHLQFGGSNFTWEYALANGVYDLTFASGDPSYTDSINSFKIENKVINDPDGQDNFDSFQTRVLIQDGRLTLTSAGTNAKLNYIDIKAVDLVAPTVASSSFGFATGHSVAVTFSEAVNPGSLSASDLAVMSTSGTGPTFTPTSVIYDPLTLTATFSFATPLPDGDFIATMASGAVADVAGNPLATPFTSTSFFALTGDANRDRKVDFADLLILAQNFGQSGRTLAGGNFDYSADGLVDFSDLLLLAQRFGTGLANAPALSIVTASTAGEGKLSQRGHNAAMVLG